MKKVFVIAIASMLMCACGYNRQGLSFNPKNGVEAELTMPDGQVVRYTAYEKLRNTLEAIGDFDGDGFDDLRIRTKDGVIGALLVKGADRLVWQEYGCLGKEWDSKPAGL